MNNKAKKSFLCSLINRKTIIITAIMISCIVAIISGVILYNKHIQDEHQRTYIEEQQAEKTIGMYDTENLQASLGFRCVRNSLIGEKFETIDTESIQINDITQVLKSVLNEDSPKYFAFKTIFTYEIKYCEKNTGKEYITYKAASVTDSAGEQYIDGLNEVNWGKNLKSHVDHSVNVSIVNEILEDFEINEISDELKKRFSNYEDAPTSVINE